MGGFDLETGILSPEAGRPFFAGAPLRLWAAVTEDDGATHTRSARDGSSASGRRGRVDGRRRSPSTRAAGGPGSRRRPSPSDARPVALAAEARLAQPAGERYLAGCYRAASWRDTERRPET
jgi:hypothetical protein